MNPNGNNCLDLKNGVAEVSMTVPPSVGMSKYLAIRAGELVIVHPSGKSN